MPLNVVLPYKNFAAHKGISHIGLGISALNTAKCLRAAGVRADVWSVVSAADLGARLRATLGVTHVVVAAPWIATDDLAALCAEWPEIGFAVNCHSNLGFLQADPNAFRLVREGLGLQRSTWNFHMAANCRPLADWLTGTYGIQAQCLPNLYHVDNAHPQPQRYTGGVLRVGVFGATRALKNHLSACGAALLMAKQMKCPLELHFNSGRSEGAGPVVEAIRQMVVGVPGVTLVDVPWQPWTDFRETIAYQHLCIACSYTESHCMVACDAIAGGVPVVGSLALRWLPRSWMADADDVNDIARVGRALLNDPAASRDGMAALITHNRGALGCWVEWLGASRRRCIEGPNCRRRRREAYTVPEKETAAAQQRRDIRSTVADTKHSGE